jgi:glycosyltransferase involved in cell wall biosynthesis
MPTPLSVSGKKPRALFLSPESPYPSIGGGPLRSASLLEYLSRRFSVHAIIFRERGGPDPKRAFPSGHIDRLDSIDLPYHSKAPVARLIRNSVRLLRARPPLMDRFSGFQESVSGLLAGEKYEVAIVEHFWCAPYLEQVQPHAGRVVLDLHNIESAWHQSLAACAHAVNAYALERFGITARGLERKWLPEFDAILVTSPAEARRARELGAQDVITVYPNALPEIPAPLRQEKDEIVFSGNLEYAPNINAVRFFRDRIWPRLRERSSVEWKILGKNPDAIRKLVKNDSRIALTGFVEDAIGALATSQVAVVPVLCGSGTRIKILEAWAAGTPVVSTSFGAEGLDGKDGEHLLIRDQPDSFADAVLHLLSSPEDRARIGRAGRRLYELCYTWPVAWRSLERVFGNG